MAEVTWDLLAAAPVHDRVSLLLDSNPVRADLADSVDRAQRVLAQDGVESSNLVDVGGAAQLLALVLAQTSIWEPNGPSNTFVKRDTSERTWEALARAVPEDASKGYRRTFAQMWCEVQDVGRERREVGGLSWLDEFVIDGSCRGWAVRRPTASEPQIPLDANVSTSIATPARAIQGWHVARHDQFIQKVLCERYSARPWWRQFGTPGEASADFWGFYAVTRWDADSLFRARYLGLAAMRTHLYSQTRAWASNYDRDSMRGHDAPGDVAVTAMPAKSTTYLDTARECVDRHKRQYGEAVAAWVELVLAMCIEPRHVLKEIPPELRGPRSTVFRNLKLFREAVARCIESQTSADGASGADR